MPLNSPHAPGYNQIIKYAAEIFKESGEDAVFDYLSEVASNDYSCPDRCDAWACSFYQENEAEIEGRE